MSSDVSKVLPTALSDSLSAIMVFVGVAGSLVISPILDRTQKHILGLKIFAVLIAALCTVLPFIPQFGSIPGLFLIFGWIGVSVFPTEPATLETQANWTHPVSPEFSSFICWSGSKVVSAGFTVLVGKTLMLEEPRNGQPKGSLFFGQLFVAGMCWLCVPCVLLLGVWKFKKPAHSEVQ